MRDFVSEMALLQMQVSMLCKSNVSPVAITKSIIATLVRAAKQAQLDFDKQTNVVSFDTKMRERRKLRYKEQQNTRRMALTALAYLQESTNNLAHMTCVVANDV